jgi:hypothetical protein
VRRLDAFVCAVLGAAVLAPSSAAAFECKLSETYSYVSLSWDTREIPFGIRTPGSSELDNGALVPRAVQDAFVEWTKPDCTDVRFDYRGVVQEGEEGVNQVVFVPSGWRFARDAVALTRTVYGTEDGVIRSATIEVNEDIFDFLDASGGCSTVTPAYDITAVLTHEVGHLLGLDHTKSFSRTPTDPTMAPEVGPCEMDKRTIEADDIAGLCLLYPSGEPPGRCKRIPAQADPYVSNTAFGCSSTRGDGLIPGLFLVLFVWVVATRTCPKARSGR